MSFIQVNFCNSKFKNDANLDLFLLLVLCWVYVQVLNQVLVPSCFCPYTWFLSRFCFGQKRNVIPKMFAHPKEKYAPGILRLFGLT